LLPPVSVFRANLSTAESVDRSFFNSPFGLDMSLPNPSISTNPNFSTMDLSFGQTLGLDLAPGYNYNYPPLNADMDLGLDLMGGEIVRQRRKRVAWIEVEKLIDGERSWLCRDNLMLTRV
jgi:hypothetical protein